LWKSKATDVDDPIGPLESHIREDAGNEANRFTTAVPKHEWDVLQDHPARAVAAALYKPKDIFDQSRAGALDANVRPDKGQILAWESPHQRVAARQRLKFADIGYQGRVSEIAA